MPLKLSAKKSDDGSFLNTFTFSPIELACLLPAQAATMSVEPPASPASVTLVPFGCAWAISFFRGGDVRLHAEPEELVVRTSRRRPDWKVVSPGGTGPLSGSAALPSIALASPARSMAMLNARRISGFLNGPLRRFGEM